ncbi:MAG TPA: hypothetical protein VN648_19800, partial [Candidatus Methylomirabilis sp.]|nr:hypothetical protein [Candidatus Methylomirabilis sp.]
NGEENRDGSSSNDSWNCGAEGPTDNPVVLELRERQKRNFMVTLMLSQGVSMLLAGDEIGHTQQGNNNAFCQDNELTWLNWDLNDRQQRFLDFTKKVSRIRREHPVFQRRRFFQGRALRGTDIKDLSFLGPCGKEMTDEDWNQAYVKCLGVRLAGDLIGDMDERGEPVVDETALILLNAHHESVTFTLPKTRDEQIWERVLDTSAGDDTPLSLRGGEALDLGDRSLVVLFTRDESEGDSSPISTSARMALAANSRGKAAGTRPPEDQSQGFRHDRSERHRPKVQGGAWCTNLTLCRSKRTLVGDVLPGVSQRKSSSRVIWPQLNSVNSLEHRFGTMPFCQLVEPKGTARAEIGRPAV